MELTKEEVINLTKFLQKQYIERNDTREYDGEVIYQFLKKAEEFLDVTETSD